MALHQEPLAQYVLVQNSVVFYLGITLIYHLQICCWTAYLHKQKEEVKPD